MKTQSPEPEAASDRRKAKAHGKEVEETLRTHRSERLICRTGSEGEPEPRRTDTHLQDERYERPREVHMVCTPRGNAELVRPASKAGRKHIRSIGNSLSTDKSPGKGDQAHLC